MATITVFEDITAWQKARKLSHEIYEATQHGTFARDFALRDQINRSTGSIMDNIAEGFERGSQFEFVQMLSYSKGSAGETRSQLYRALDRRHIDSESFERWKLDTVDIGKLVAGFMTYLNQTEIRGEKFKGRRARN